MNTAAWALSLAAGVAILLVRSSQAGSRFFGVFLVAESLTGLGFNLLAMEDSAEGRRGIEIATQAFALVVPVAALAFVARWPRPRLRGGRFPRSLLVAAIIAAIEVVYFATLPVWMGTILPVAMVGWLAAAIVVWVLLRGAEDLGEGPVRESAFLVGAFTTASVLVDTLYLALTAYPRSGAVAPFVTWALSVLGCYVVTSATVLYVRRWRGPPSSARRRRDRVLAGAWLVGAGGALAGVVVYHVVSPQRGFLVWELTGSFACAGALLALAFAVVRYQAFGLDVKVKWAIGRGTVAAAFVAVFFVASEGAQTVLAERVGPVLGLAAAGLLVFALAPLQRFAERVSEAALPGVKPVTRMSADEKAALYFDQARFAWGDGSLSAKDRQILDVARTRLGLSLEEAHGLEARAVAETPRAA